MMSEATWAGEKTPHKLTPKADYCGNLTMWEGCFGDCHRFLDLAKAWLMQ